MKTNWLDVFTILKIAFSFKFSTNSHLVNKRFANKIEIGYLIVIIIDQKNKKKTARVSL